MPKSRKGRIHPSLRRLAPGVIRPRCPRCGGPVGLVSRDNPAYHVCPGCCGFLWASRGHRPTRDRSEQDRADRDRDRYTLPKCRGRGLSLLERVVGEELARTLRGQSG